MKAVNTQKLHDPNQWRNGKTNYSEHELRFTKIDIAGPLHFVLTGFYCIDQGKVTFLRPLTSWSPRPRCWLQVANPWYRQTYSIYQSHRIFPESLRVDDLGKLHVSCKYRLIRV